MALNAILSAAFLVFLIGLLMKIARNASMPAHVRWELYPIPNGAVAQIRVMSSEIFFLKGVFESNKPLWLWSWLFHSSLYLLIAAEFLSFIAAGFAGIIGAIEGVITLLLYVAFVCGILGTAGTIAVRLFSRKLRPYSSFASFFNLALLFAIFASGFIHVLLQPNAAGAIIEQSGSLIMLNNPPQLHPAAVVHLCFVALFMAVYPFSQMAHAVAKYFAYHSVRWDDRSVDQIPNHASRLAKYLAFPVSWSATHVRGGKVMSWSDVVSSDGAKEEKKPNGTI
jgi:nitrate reductase gamma subunit